MILDSFFRRLARRCRAAVPTGLRPMVCVLAVTCVGVCIGCGKGDPEPAARPTARGTTPLAEAVFMPAEFDPQDALLLGASRLFELFPQVLVDIVQATHDSIRIVALVKSEDFIAPIRALLTENGAPADAVEFRVLPILTMWIRDFGPITVVDHNERRTFIDFVYRERRGNALDNDVPVHLAESLSWPRREISLLLEGGDFLTNGRGLGLGSTRLINRNVHYLVLEPDSIVTRMAAALGFESFQFVQPLLGESTGHLDMFCAFVRPDLIVVGQYGEGSDPENIARLDKAAADLAARPTRQGPLRVERIPMPPAAEGTWRSYTNIVFANGVVLVPVYPGVCPDLDEAALALYGRLLPERTIVGIDASGLIGMRGALRCITMNVPVGALPRP